MKTKKIGSIILGLNLLIGYGFSLGTKQFPPSVAFTVHNITGVAVDMNVLGGKTMTNTFPSGVNDTLPSLQCTVSPSTTPVHPKPTTWLSVPAGSNLNCKVDIKDILTYQLPPSGPLKEQATGTMTIQNIGLRVLPEGTTTPPPLVRNFFWSGGFSFSVGATQVQGQFNMVSPYASSGQIAFSYDYITKHLQAYFLPSSCYLRFNRLGMSNIVNIPYNGIGLTTGGINGDVFPQSSWEHSQINNKVYSFALYGCKAPNRLNSTQVTSNDYNILLPYLKDIYTVASPDQALLSFLAT